MSPFITFMRLIKDNDDSMDYYNHYDYAEHPADLRRADWSRQSIALWEHTCELIGEVLRNERAPS